MSKIALPFTKEMHIVELGGGENPMRGLAVTNVDIRELPQVDIVRNLEEDFSDVGVYDGLFAKYVIEHISWTKIPLFLRCCYNILKPGASAIFIMPDTEAQMKMILEKPLTLEDSCLLFGAQDYGENSHKTAFSKTLITELLKGTGFTTVNITDFPDPNARDIIVEAVRGEGEADAMTKINFGSFTVTFGHGWINADLRGDIQELVEAKGHLFLPLDVREKLPWEDESVDLITAHHLLEHLTRKEGKAFLRECYRVLKPSGVIRVSTPGLKRLISKYDIFKIEFYEENEGVRNSDDSDEAFFRMLTDGHKTVYSEFSLPLYFRDIGFDDIRIMDYGISRSDIIMRETEDSFPSHSIYCEAEKPAYIESMPVPFNITVEKIDDGKDDELVKYLGGNIEDVRPL
jgi:predicted SAM-dependent methyltransferase